MTSASLKYSDATDRAFGLCGTALALFIYDAERYIFSLSLDAPADRGISLTPDFYTVNNPNVSAKIIWQNEYRRFQLVAAMTMGNLLCRSITRRRSDLSQQVQNLMLSHLMQEGEATCGLETSEVRNIIGESFSYLRRLFMHPTINKTLNSMAQELKQTHTLDRDRVLSYLLPLNRI